MPQQRLNSMALLYIEQEVVDAIELQKLLMGLLVENPENSLLNLKMIFREILKFFFWLKTHCNRSISINFIIFLYCMGAFKMHKN